MTACIYFVFMCGVYDFIEKNSSFTRALAPEYSLVHFQQTIDGSVLLNNQTIDSLDVHADQLDVFSRDEYYFVNNGTLFHRLSNVSSLALDGNNGERQIDCISFDSFTNNLWWTDSTHNICSFTTGCRQVAYFDARCAALEVTNDVTVLLTREGVLFIDGARQSGYHSRIEIIPRLRQDTVSYLHTLLVMLVLLLIYTAVGGGRRRSNLTLPFIVKGRSEVDPALFVPLDSVSSRCCCRLTTRVSRLAQTLFTTLGRNDVNVPQGGSGAYGDDLTEHCISSAQGTQQPNGTGECYRPASGE